MLDARDTILAAASSASAGAATLLRLSGPAAFPLVLRRFSAHGPQPSAERGAWAGTFLCELLATTPDGPQVRSAPCPAFLLFFPGPHSATGEDVAELVLPPSPALLRATLRLLTADGARPAQPGEFSWRAFRNGRIELGQAEATARLVAAASEAERREALARLASPRTAEFRRWRDELTGIMAEIEATLDFEAEELDAPPADGLISALRALAGRFRSDSGAAPAPARHPRIALAGMTNVGKSALANALLGRDAHLVSPAPSTTRDRLAATLRLGSAETLLEDLPGLDPQADATDREAIDRARLRIESADMVCLVLDAAAPPPAPLAAWLAPLDGARALIALSRCDLPARLDPAQASAWGENACGRPLRVIRTSANTGEGVECLRSALAASLESARSGAGMLSARESAALREAADACERAAVCLERGLESALAAEELRLAGDALARLQGADATAEVIDAVFSRFCVGK